MLACVRANVREKVLGCEIIDLSAPLVAFACTHAQTHDRMNTIVSKHAYLLIRFPRSILVLPVSIQVEMASVCSSAKSALVAKLHKTS